MMGQIVYIQGAICSNDQIELFVYGEKCVLGLIFPDMFQCILMLPCFYIPKYTADMYEAERTCN